MIAHNKRMAPNASAAAPPPTVMELIAEHSTAIAQLLADNKDFANTDIGVQFDDLFVLRYVLSAKGDIKVAGRKLRETLEWRSTKLETLNVAATGRPPHYDRLSKFNKDGIVGWLGNDLLHVVRVGLGDTAAALAAVSEEDFIESFMYSSEMQFRMLDQRTRETGVLCKLISVIDLYGFSMSRFSRKFPAILAKNSHSNNVFYPQLLRCTVIMSLPMVMRVLMKATAAIMPKETVEKQRVCAGKPHGGKQTAADCPFLRFKLGGSGEAAVAMLPPFLGGTAPVPDSLKHESD